MKRVSGTGRIIAAENVQTAVRSISTFWSGFSPFFLSLGQLNMDGGPAARIAKLIQSFPTESAERANEIARTATATASGPA